MFIQKYCYISKIAHVGLTSSRVHMSASPLPTVCWSPFPSFRIMVLIPERITKASDCTSSSHCGKGGYVPTTNHYMPSTTQKCCPKSDVICNDNYTWIFPHVFTSSRRLKLYRYHVECVKGMLKIESQVNCINKPSFNLWMTSSFILILL